MKKLMLIAAALMIGSAAVQAQTQEAYPSNISVTGKAERELVPNEIYVKIIIDEADGKSKATVAEQERKMIAELRKLGIDVEKDLQVGDMTGDLKSYVLKKDKVQTSKSYILKVRDAETLGKVYESLGNMNISKMSITKVTRNDLDKIRMELRVEAMKNAKEIAGELAGAVGQKIGKAYNIVDYNYEGGGIIYYDNAAPIARAKVEMVAASGADDTSLEFQNLKLSYSVSVKFILE